MRIKIEFETEYENLPIDYRRKFLSYIKRVLQNYDKELFSALYEGNSPKEFCFSINFLPKVIIEKDFITLRSKRFCVCLTTHNILMGIHLVNAFMACLNRWHSLADCNNKLKAISINKVQERFITSNAVLFKILSPIVIRDHNKKEGKDWYLTFTDDGFKEIWKRNLKTELKNIFGRDVSKDIDELEIIPVDLKKIVVKNYDIFIPCTIGRMVVEGEKYLLEYFYKAGMGSRRSLGFGCLDIV